MDALARQQWGDQLRADTAALRLLGEELAQEVSQSAGRIAKTQEEVARVHDVIADSGVSACVVYARERAERARRFAQHKRHEQHRWSHDTAAD